jgi:hypothetical protein
VFHSIDPRSLEHKELEPFLQYLFLAKKDGNLMGSESVEDTAPGATLEDAIGFAQTHNNSIIKFRHPDSPVLGTIYDPATALTTWVEGTAILRKTDTAVGLQISLSLLLP